jgi:cell division protein FtsI/penicillin-binding protein 2
MPSIRINKILAVILAACSIIILRVWHLTVVQREEKLLEAQKPQSRTILMRANRGTISDRFQRPLALNKICYNAAVYYDQITEVPAVQWTQEEGQKIKLFPRKKYIKELSLTLAKILHLEADRLEDLIHSKASLFPHAPFIVKAKLSEKEYYHLKAIEKDWPGIYAEIGTERFYPLGKTGCHLLGMMGAIQKKEYEEIAKETAELEETIQCYREGREWTLPLGIDSFDAVHQRLYELKEKAYRLNDLVGKTGIEKQLEEELRGYFGKKSFEVDLKGRFVRELPGTQNPVEGRHITLSISTELQQFAESLLTKSEKDREGRSLGVDPVDKQKKVQKQPWIKGGAIVVLDPNNGEILAWASSPRFDPNDFIPSINQTVHKRKQKQICKWLENEFYIGSVWDGKDFLVREKYTKKFVEEEIPLDWDLYLDFILAKDSPIKDFFHRIDDIKGAVQIQEDFETLLYFAPHLTPLSLLENLFSLPQKLSLPSDTSSARKRIETALHTIPNIKDKLFAIDLCRLIVDSTRFSDALLSQMGGIKLHNYRNLTQAFQRVALLAKIEAQQTFHQGPFVEWREKNQKSFLDEMRREEKERKTYARPYLDYLDKKEKELFASYWEDQKFSFLNHLLDREIELKNSLKNLSAELQIEFLRTFRSFQELDRPLLGTYSQVKCRGQRKEALEKDLAASFYPSGGFGFGRSYAFQTSAPLGSVFKVVTSYEALKQGASLTLIDKLGQDPHLPLSKGEVVAYGLNHTPYHRIYKGGRLPKSHSPHIGKIDLMGALEQSSNPYFSILAGDFLQNPDDLKMAAHLFGFGEKTGVELPGETKGNLPVDLKTNRTGLYSFAIGQHTLLSTPIQAAVMLGALANGGKVLKPKIVLASDGLSPDRKPLSAFSCQNDFAKKELDALGIHYSLFTKVKPGAPISNSQEESTVVKNQLNLSASIRSSILGGMDLVMWGAKGGARPSVIRSLRNSSLLQNHLKLEHQIVGKTGTAEILYNPNINPSSKAEMYKHTWFGAISFHPTKSGKANYNQPELVIVVFTRYGEAGKEGAPIAAQLVQKWREIRDARN